VGQLVEGRWSTDWYETQKTGGQFIRPDAPYRNWITADGKAGPSGDGGFAAEAGRYHLYVSYACPWAHRVLVFRALKGLEAILPVSVVSPKMPDETGWTFRDDGSTGDALFGSDHLYEVYQRANPGYTGRVTVPVLWDKQRQTIVNNESSEIIRMLNSAFNGLTGNEDDYYPQVLRPRIDEINKRVYDTVNNGVYKAGFATRQAAYEENVRALFESLDWIEDILSDNAYLTGGQVTEADWRLFTTLVRFDAVYYGHFKCNIRQIADYPNISHYLKGLVATPGVRETIHIDHIKTHYYWSHTRINPTQIVPVGPELAFLD
jgi:putative glutathione S-transferase